MKERYQVASGKVSIFFLIYFAIFSWTFPTELCSQVLIEIENHPTFGFPFDITTIGENIFPDLIDIDGDLDLDLIYGNELGEMYKQENIGTPTAAIFDDPLPFLPTGGLTYAKPRLIDIDNDGDLDVFIGSDDGKIHFYRRTSFGYSYEGTNLFNMNPGIGHCSLVFGDIDLDGDYDLFIGTEDELLYARNLGTQSIPDFGPVQTNPFGFNPSSLSRLTLEMADYNADGTLDLLVGYFGGGMFIYYNQGSMSIPDYNSRVIAPVSSSNAQSAPAVGDIDNDGDMDLLLARRRLGPTPNVHVYMSTNAPPSFELNLDHPFFGDSTWGGNVAVDLGDFNSDGDLDLVVGNAAGEINIAENVGTLTDFQFDEMQVLPFGLSDTEGQATPQWIDLDRDNTFDIYAGSAEGNIWKYENMGGVGSPSFILRGINSDDYIPQDNLSAPSFGSIDGFGEQMYCGSADGKIYYFDNTLSFPDLSWSFIEASPFGLSDVGFTSAPDIIDIDGDGDRDLFVGALDGNIHYFENTGVTTDPQFEAKVLNPFGITKQGLLSKPSLGDIDRDGDYDLLVGYTSGKISFFENRPCLTHLQLNHIDRNQHLYQSDSTITTRALFRTGTNNSLRALDAMEFKFGFEVSEGAELQMDIGRCINN